ncbi:hypothetical protein ACNTMW_33985 [Planosporangium sp. 12N6]|uniref:hypothetical protein n=1 Tax=Planosporangium spinosum TaxID=3402278 RepID=UPI003CF77983
MAWAPLRALLGTQPLTLTELAACAVVATLPGGGLVVTRIVARRGRRPSPIGTSGSATTPANRARIEATREV